MPAEFELLKREGSCLRELRTNCLREFIELHEDMSFYHMEQNSFYLLNIITNAIFGTSDILANKSLHDEKFVPSSWLVYTIAGAFIMCTPWTSLYLAKFVKRRDHNRLVRTFNQDLNTKSQLKDYLAQSLALHSAMGADHKDKVVPILDRLNLYEKTDTTIGTVLEGQEAHFKHAEQVAVQSRILAPMIGATDVNKGILELVGYYDFTRPKVHRHNTATLGLAASIGTIVGASSSVLFNAYKFGKGVHYVRKLNKSGLGISDKVKQQAIVLDQLEQRARGLAN